MQFNISEEHARCSGIYIIRNSVNSKVYIGSAKHLLFRYRTHLCVLGKGKHNRLLQNFINKYGIDTLYFELLELVPDVKDLLDREQYYLDTYQPYKRANGFNICIKADSRMGVKTNPEVVERMRGRKCSPEARINMSLAKKGKKIPHFDYQKIHQMNRERKVSDETKKKITDSRIGEKNPGVKLTESDVLAIRKLYHTMSYKVIAEKYSLSPFNVRHIIKGNTWQHLPLEDYSSRQRGAVEEVSRNGENHTNSKLKDSDVLQIRKLYHTHSQQQIADQYSIGRRHIGDIINGVCWPHLPLETYNKPKRTLTP